MLAIRPDGASGQVLGCDECIVVGVPDPARSCLSGCPASGIPLALQVRDCEGNPIPNASVCAGVGTCSAFFGFTDACGRLVLGAVGPTATIYADGVPVASVAGAQCSPSARCGSPLVRFPGEPEQDVNAGTCATGSSIQLRRPDLPQGLTLALRLPAFGTCAGAATANAWLFPRSGTGPITPLRLLGSTPFTGTRCYSGYFAITNLTAPGLYDVAVQCESGAVDTARIGLRYDGYLGYQPSGRILNSASGNTIRGARVSIWRQVAGGGLEWYGGQIASDATYSFDVPPGTYRILVQYELAGEHWMGPFDVGTLPSAGLPTVPVPYQDIAVAAVTPDAIAPVFATTTSGETVWTGVVTDAPVGLAVLEPMVGSLVNGFVEVPDFAAGATSVEVAFRLADTTSTGSVVLRAIDRLGNSREHAVQLTGRTGATPAPRSGHRFAIVGPNPFRDATRVRLEVAREVTVDVRVRDAWGRQVTRLVSGSLPPGRHDVDWNGCDERGRPVPPGVYVIDARMGAYSEARRAIRLR